MAGTATITAPAVDSQAGFSTPSVSVSWTFAGTAGATQTQRRVTATPVGQSTPTFDTGMAASGATTATVTGFATGVSYNVVVSVIDSAGGTSSATRIVVSNYTRPLPAVLTPTALEQGLSLAITNPTDGSRPAVTTNDVYRRLAGSGASWTYLGRVGVNATFLDLTAQAVTAYEYFVRSNGSIDSPTMTVTTAPMMGAWVHELSALNPGATLNHFVYAAAATESVDLETAFHSFVGRTYPVAETGVERNDSLAISLRLTPDVRQAVEATWRDWKARAPMLLYRDGRGRAYPAAIDGPIQISPDGPGGIIAATLRRVDYVPAMLAASAYNYSTNVDGGYGVGGYGSNGYGN